jgi:hypothetical protein
MSDYDEKYIDQVPDQGAWDTHDMYQIQGAATSAIKLDENGKPDKLTVGDVLERFIQRVEIVYSILVENEEMDKEEKIMLLPENIIRNETNRYKIEKLNPLAYTLGYITTGGYGRKIKKSGFKKAIGILESKMLSGHDFVENSNVKEPDVLKYAKWWEANLLI